MSQHKPLEGGKFHGQLLSPDQFVAAAINFKETPIQTDKDLLDRIKAAYPTDPSLTPILTFLAQDSSKVTQEIRDRMANYTMDHGILLRDGLVVVPQDQGIRRDVVMSRHDSLMAGHPGQARTMELVSCDYWWPHMRKWVNKYVDTCDKCKRTKPLHKQRHGTLAPLPVPNKPWSDITYDLITELPPSLGFTAILVVVCHFTKMAHFIPTTNEVTAEGVADLFHQRVWSQHGLPDRTVSDRGTQFNNRFLRRLYDLLGIQPSFSTAYHPQTDGQSERVNQELEQYLRAYVNYHQDDWSSLLTTAEFAYNNAVNKSTGLSPFYAYTGFHPRLTPKEWSTSTVPAAEERITALKEIQEELQASMTLANERVKHFHDQHRLETPQFQPGQKVWLRADNVKTTRPTKKLDDRLLGPFEVEQRLSDLAYKLKLPSSMKVHPVFYVGLLEPHTEDPIPGRSLPSPDPIITDEGEEESTLR